MLPSRRVFRASSALLAVCSSTKRDDIYRKLDCVVDFPENSKLPRGERRTIDRDGAKLSRRPAKRSGVVPSLEQAQGMGASNGLGAALDSQFAVDVVDMALYRADGDDKLPRHRCI